MRRQKVNEMRLYPDRAHPRATATVRNAKRFVQIEMTHIGANICRTTEPNKRVQIRTVHVNLPTRTMNNIAYFANLFLKHTVR